MSHLSRALRSNGKVLLASAGFDTKVAVALGNITIVGGSLSNFVFNAPRRHAIFNRPLIDWDLILVSHPVNRDP